MTPAQITAIATLVAEAARAGVSVVEILREARDQGGVTDAQWQEITDAIEGAEREWKQAGR